MELIIDVGDEERHTLEFYWGQFLGSVRVKVDGDVVYRGRPIAFEELETLSHPYLYLYRTFIAQTTPTLLVRTWEFTVGSSESHLVRIDKLRPKLLAGIRPSLFRIFIDGELVGEERGY